MKDLINKAVDETLKAGIGQTIISFGAWGYVLVLIVVTIYYALSCITRLILKKS